MKHRTIVAWPWPVGVWRFEPLGYLMDTTFSVVAAMDANGDLIVGANHFANGTRPFAWTPLAKMALLAPVRGSATGVSADGSVVAGSFELKLPFDPLPIARFRLDNTWLNRQVTISGWGANATPTPVTGSGGRVQRTGRTVILGTPTEADFHPEDPNPGMLNAAVRQNQIKTDGRAPNSNACFGDSGGPLIVNQNGQDRIGGVFYFTGLSCEDYNLHTRLDPFLPFLDEGFRKGGQAPLVPKLDCVAPNANGTLTAYFGYKNDNGLHIDVPYGTRNVLALDTPGFRPKQFLPGEHHFVFGVDFTLAQTVTYKLSPENSPTTTLTATKSSPRCGATQDECAGFCRALDRSGCTDQNFENCFVGCASLANDIAEFVPACSAANTAWNECTANTAPGAANWLCIPEANFAIAPSCDPELEALNVCLSGG